MAALTATEQRNIRGRLTQAFKVADAAQFYAGSFAALRLNSFATTADRGYAEPYTAAAGTLPLSGFAERGVLGDTDADVPPEVELSIDGYILRNKAVTGVTAITDVGSLVYLSNDNDLTLTRPTYGVPCGIIVRWHTSTSCDILMFSLGELVVLSLSGGGKMLIPLGSFDLATINASASQQNLRTGIVLPFHGKIVDFFAMVDVALTAGTSTEGVTLSLEIDGTDVAGGDLEAQSGDAAAAKLTSTDITGDNEFHEGSLLDVQIVELNTGDDLTAGRVDLFIEVEILPGV